MSRLVDLYQQEGQSPWLDNLRRGYLTSGQLQDLIDQGIRGLTSNPTIFQKAIEGSTDYDAEFGELVGGKVPTDAAYWQMAVEDIGHALDLFAPLFDESGGTDGFVSLEVDPGLARKTAETTAAARDLHARIARPNLLVKIPGTAEGLPSIRSVIGDGHNVNVTLIFSLERYEEVIEAYLSGLEDCDGDLARIHSVASFFVSRVDTEVDRRLEAIGTEAALGLRGKAAVSQAKLAYQHFLTRFSGPRWDALAARGARVQRPLWASTSTKNPAYPSTLYVDTLIGPDTVNTMPDITIDAFQQQGTVARTIDDEVDDARAHLDGLAAVGIELDDVTRVLEDEGVASFSKSFDELLASLEAKADRLRG